MSVTFTVVERTCAVAPARLFKAMWLDNHNFYPTAMPHYIKSAQILEEGDSNFVGCVKLFNFQQGTPHIYFKSKNLEVDAEKYYIKYTTFEGDVLGENIENVVYEVNIEETGHFKMVAHFNPKGDAVLTTEEEVECNLKGLVKALDASEGYLLKNPDVYA